MMQSIPFEDSDDLLRPVTNDRISLNSSKNMLCYTHLETNYSEP